MPTSGFLTILQNLQCTLVLTWSKMLTYGALRKNGLSSGLAT